MGYSFKVAARVILYAPSHIQDNTYHSLCYTSRGALVGTRNSSMGPRHEGSIRRPIAQWANTLTMELYLAPTILNNKSKEHVILFFTKEVRLYSMVEHSFMVRWVIWLIPQGGPLIYIRARCSSVVRAFAHGAMGHLIDPSCCTHWAISCSSQCSV